MFGRKKTADRAGDTPQLREHALNGPAPSGADAQGPIVVMMDLPAGGGMASVVSFVDGTTSLYTSVGGGVIGIGEHPQANQESREFLALAVSLSEHFRPGGADGALGQDDMRFVLRIGDALSSATATTVDVTNEGHPLAPLHSKGQRVLTLIRLISEEQERVRGSN